jgi:transposase
MADAMSERAAAKNFGISRKTVSKMVHHTVPPGYQRKDRPVAPKLGAFVGIIHQILQYDRDVLKKQRHTAQRIFERLRDEHQYAGGYTVVREFVAKERLRQQEVFIPLAHPPGHAQADFGEADIYLGGIKTRIHYFCMDLPQSDAIFVKAYPAETTDAFLDGHVAAFAWLGGVPKTILYDNIKIAVAEILGDGKRKRTKAFSELQSHYLFEDRFGHPASRTDSQLAVEVLDELGLTKVEEPATVWAFAKFMTHFTIQSVAMSFQHERDLTAVKRQLRRAQMA